jgi:hypothetical protein
MVNIEPNKSPAREVPVWGHPNAGSLGSILVGGIELPEGKLWPEWKPEGSPARLTVVTVEYGCARG